VVTGHRVVFISLKGFVLCFLYTDYCYSDLKGISFCINFTLLDAKDQVTRVHSI
jgi:hypothetical protein